MENKSHWENVYATKGVTEVSWYRTHLEKSLDLIAHTGVGKEGRIIDVGGGASTLVDDLLTEGYRHLTVLDISAAALAEAKARLGTRADKVTWLEADITETQLPHHHYDLWHDRAVFHFLTRAENRRRYVNLVRHALKPSGHITVACFGPNGPLKCSGLDIVRYGPDQLHGEFGGDFQLVRSVSEEHITPAGKQQQFTYCYCRMR